MSNCSNAFSGDTSGGGTIPPVGFIATYELKSFLPPYNGEKYLQLRDVHGIIRFKIYNNTLTVRYVSGNILNLKIRSENKIISLDFATANEAQLALIKLSEVYNQIRQDFN